MRESKVATRFHAKLHLFIFMQKKPNYVQFKKSSLSKQTFFNLS